MKGQEGRWEENDWAQSLVGRNWEIFWDDSHHDNGPTTSTEAENSNAAVAPATDSVEVVEGDESDSDEGDWTDWYESRIVSALNRGEEGVIFQIQFEGDDDVYSMPLTPSLARPSSRTWIRRTIAIFSSTGLSGAQDGMRQLVDMAAWEKSLPHDTATLADLPKIEQIRKATSLERILGRNLVPDLMQRTSPLHSTNPSQPCQTDLEEMLHLLFLVRVQILLGSRLAPLGGSSRKIKTDVGEIIATDAYLDFLSTCLEELEKAIIWYCHCWAFYMQFPFSVQRPAAVLDSASARGGSIGDTRLPTSADGRTIPPAMDAESRCIDTRANYELDNRTVSNDTLQNGSYMTQTIESSDSGGHNRAPHNPLRVSRDCLGKGSDSLVSVVNIDLAFDGATFQKRSIPGPSSTRRTKRRKMGDGVVADWFEETSESEDLDDDSARAFGRVSSESLLQFARSTMASDGRWYLHHMAKLLVCVCCQLYDPIRCWTQEAESILRESESESNRDKIDSDAEEKEEAEVDADSVSNSLQGDLQRFYTYDEVYACSERSKRDELLRMFDLSPWWQALHLKLQGIAAFESETWRLLKQLYDYADDESETPKADDKILRSLLSLQDQADSCSSYVGNVAPLGTSKTNLTRDGLKNAVASRSWLLDLRHAMSNRERTAFVQNVISNAENLAHFPEASFNGNQGQREPLVSCPAHVIAHLGSLSSDLQSFSNVTEKYDERLSTRDGGEFTSVSEVSSALNHLSSFPFLSIAEEKLAVRLDVLKWNDEAAMQLSQTQRFPSFHDVAEMNQLLEELTEGNSPTRLRLIGSLETNSIVNSIIGEFAEEDVSNFCVETAPSTRNLFGAAYAWKGRADAVLTSLRLHGNDLVGNFEAIAKPPAMVDSKRIEDLLQDIGSLKVNMPDHYVTTLTAVVNETENWATSIENVIMESSEVLDSLSLLLNARESRPKGIIMDPPRHIVDSWIELLDWHTRVRSCLGKLRSLQTQKNDDEKSSSLEFTDAHILLAEGLDLVEFFGQRGKDVESIKMNSRMVQHFPTLAQRSLRAISRTKLESSAPGKRIMQCIGNRQLDLKHGSPMLSLLYILWRLMVHDFLHRQEAVADLAADPKQLPTIEEAMNLRDMRPRLLERPPVGNQQVNYFQCLFTNDKSPQVTRFCETVAAGEKSTRDARLGLLSIKDIFCGSIADLDEITSYHAKLRDIQLDFKNRSGLTLDGEIEDRLDKTVKDLSWLIKAFSFEVLRSDQLSPGVTPSCDNNDPEAPAQRVPWDVLVGLIERKPSWQREDQLGRVMAGATVRVQELYDAANAWQEQVSSMMPMSFRGIKRRGPSGTAGFSEVVAPRVDFRTLDRMAKDPVLRAVAMPREGAVLEVVKKAREFELKVSEVFDVDFEGESLDKARLPKSGSLVGKKGEFPLYRLTGSVLYCSLKEKISQISHIGASVLAETPGKVMFEWVVKAVSWIDSLNRAASYRTLFEGSTDAKLVITSIDATKILCEGRKLFLEVPEAIRKSLSSHKIHISTNKQTEKLTVQIAKGGAHHSSGGTALRWCPYLLESLKLDIAKLNQWKETLQATTQTVTKLTSAPRLEVLAAKLIAARECFDNQDNLDSILYCGRNSLVVVPEESSLLSVLNLKKELDSLTKEIILSTPDSSVVDRIMKERNNGAAGVKDRFLLLDALVTRSRIERSETVEIPALEDSSHFRGKSRMLLDRSFQKGIVRMGVGDTQLNGAEGTTQAFCAIMARDLERVIFSKLQGVGNGKIAMSSGYREKVRSLRYNLEDEKNPTLCARVLAGEITPERLVAMSADELASKDLRLMRARAQEESTKSVVLAGPNKSKHASSVATAASRGSPVPMKTIVQVTRDLKSAQASRSPRSNDRNETVQKRAASASPPPPSRKGKIPGKKEPLKDGKGGKSPSELRQSPTSSSQRVSSPATLSSLLKSVSPPPPPRQSPVNSSSIALPHPHAASSISGSLPSTGASGLVVSSPLLTNDQGEDRFTFSFSHPNINFRAGLYLEDSRFSGLYGVIPEQLVVKGRLKTNVFASFVADKLSRGSWRAILLRLITFSPLDSSEYKQFYKTYEGKKRIAMIGIGKETKMFLVTPMFHGVSGQLCELFTSVNSTYAVVLTKENFYSKFHKC